MKTKSLKQKLIHFLKGKQGGAAPIAIKVLTAVVCGALILSGTYGVISGVVLPNTTNRVESMFSYDVTEGGEEGEFGGGSGTPEVVPTVEELQETYDFQYYSTMALAVSDANAGTIGTKADIAEENKADAVAGLYVDEGGIPNVVLMQDHETAERLKPNAEMIINLGGKTLSSANTVVIDSNSNKLTIDGRLEGSKIEQTGSSNVLQFRTGTVNINGGTYINNASSTSACSIVMTAAVSNFKNAVFEITNSQGAINAINTTAGVSGVFENVIINGVSEAGQSAGFVNKSSAGIELKNVVVNSKATNATAFGLINNTNSKLTMTGGSINATGSAQTQGIRNLTSQGVILENVEITSSAGGDCDAFGVINTANSTLTIVGGKIDAKSSAYSYGVDNISSLGINLQNVNIDSSSTATDKYSYGILNEADSKLNVSGGEINSTSAATAVGVDNRSSMGMELADIKLNVLSTASDKGACGIFQQAGESTIQNVDISVNAYKAYGIDNIEDSKTSITGGSITATGGSTIVGARTSSSGGLTIQNVNVDASSTGSDSFAYGVVAYNESSLTLKGGSVKSSANYKANGVALGADSTNGIADIENANIKAYASVDAKGINISTTGSSITIKDSSVYADCNEAQMNTQDVQSVGIKNYGTLNAINTNIEAVSPYYGENAVNSIGSSYDALSMGVAVAIDALETNLTNCNIKGMHSGVSAKSGITVNGGTYEGLGHGGFYFCHTSDISHVKNATIRQCSNWTEYSVDGNGNRAGFYIGGSNKDDITVYMDNCDIYGELQPIVLRGGEGEENNKLYISNSEINTDATYGIRIDNTTHKLYCGTGNNFTIDDLYFSHITKEEAESGVFITTTDTYCQD